MAEEEWEEIQVPRGAFIGWGNNPGQSIEGRVMDYDERGGEDYAGDPCPEISIALTSPADSYNKAGERTEFDAGELIQLTAGQMSLKRQVRKADPHPGDLIRIELSDLVTTKSGNTVKEYAVKILRNRDKGNTKRAKGNGGGKVTEADADLPNYLHQ